MRPFAWCLLAAALFGASTPAAKALLASTSPLVLAGLLYLGAALGALPFAFRGGSLAAARQPRNMLRVAGVIVFGGVLGPALLLLGLARAPSASVSLWLNLETVATALIGHALFHEALTRKTLAAVGLVTFASVLVTGALGLGAHEGGGAAGALVQAALLVAAACACWGLDNNLSSLIDGLTPAQSTVLKGLAAGAFNLALGLALGGAHPSLDVVTIVGALAVGAVGYGLSIALYVRGAQHLGAVRAQMIFASAPFFGVGLAWLALHDAIEPPQVAGAVLMAGALIVARRDVHVHAHAHVAQTHTHWHRHDDGHHAHVHAHDAAPAGDGWHVHEHTHERVEHAHEHRPDLHHRHPHPHPHPHEHP